MAPVYLVKNFHFKNNFRAVRNKFLLKAKIQIKVREYVFGVKYPNKIVTEHNSISNSKMTESPEIPKKRPRREPLPRLSR